MPSVISSPANPSRLLGPIRPELIRRECLADLFEATARRRPDHPALIFGDGVLSYGELDALADRVAGRLIEAGVRPGQIVGLWLPRGLDLLTMQLGIAKTGAAWLPFDAETPPERIAICLEDAHAAGLVVDAAGVDRVADLLAAQGASPPWTAEFLAAPTAIPGPRRPDVTPDQPAYVIYTSGSTGKPKGIRIDQGAICHFLRSENAMLGVGEDDRVYQGFSLAFDMSFEEIWISYLVGATLWLAPRELCADPEALPLALNEQRITVLHAVPTLLALFAREVDSLRLINLGGEACPPALVERWARPGRRIFNTYGPTEATVSASLAELHAGQPVTIGRPLPNYGLLVIDPAVENGLRLLPRGESGELCITGPGVATAYLGRPELSAEKFLVNPWADSPRDARLYRTGDLARIDDDGCVHCLGRTDDQVKIRGFRVELGEIEAALCRRPGVGTAAVLLRHDDGIERLVAYLVAESEPAPTPGALRGALAESLPPYMVPVHLEFLPEMPRLTSGKIDRKALRARPLVFSSGGSGVSDIPETPAETALFAELATLFPGQPIHRAADFFADLGGHSLFAARLASALRAHPAFARFTVRDVYKYRGIGRIAEALAECGAQAPSAEPEWTPPDTRRRWLCGAAQAATIPGLIVLRMAQWLAPFFAYHFFTGDPDDSLALAVAVSVAVFVLATGAEFAIAVAAKWVLLGRLQPGRYPLWGATYFRWWLADRLIEGAPVYMLGGSPLLIWWLRALGAQIGEETIIGSVTMRGHDLVRIGDRVSIGNAVNFENVRVERGQLLVGPITVADTAYVGSYSVLEGNTHLAEGAHLDGQSALSDGTTVPAGRFWLGSPARDGGAFDVSALKPRPAVSRCYRAWENLFFATGCLATAVLFFMPVFPTFILIDWLDDIYPWLQSDRIELQLIKYFVLAFPATAVLIVCTVLLSAGLRWSLHPRLHAGSWPIHSGTYRCRWLVNQIQEASLNVLHGVYATVYAPWWYRLLGAQVGRDAEISTAQGLIPDLLNLGDETFIADAVMLGDEEIDGGWMTMQPTVVSRRSFVGNGAYVPDGTVLPENVLIGVHSRVPDNAVIHSGETWLGSPPVRLPAREQTAGFPENLTFRPSPRRRIGRGAVEAFRIVTPHAAVIAVGYTTVLNIMPLAEAGQWGAVVWTLNVAGLLYGIGAFAFVALLKWVLIGRYDRRAQPMWTPFVWFSEAITNLYEGITVPYFMSYLRGTPLLPLAFRLLGSRVGHGVYLDTTDFTEFDCVHIGDYSELNALSCPQTHLFEDRVMKIDHVRIGRLVSISPRSAVLYSAEVADGARLGPLTLVMKGERIPDRSHWHGIPAAPA
ncbi:MAG TPA: amino acid adenylation domain-containing protein [Accumulibacter sp.]|jgi:non-ribosomal peptide synthetase-like protein|nr:amino acid adenylation domain-containing protein [Accumulibacter sp.]